MLLSSTTVELCILNKSSSSREGPAPIINTEGLKEIVRFLTFANFELLRKFFTPNPHRKLKDKTKGMIRKEEVFLKTKKTENNIPLLKNFFAKENIRLVKMNN